MFLFLGLDACDFKLLKEFGHFENLPIDFSPLEQDLPEVISEKGVKKDYTGWWTFYVWGAILSGQIDTPEMEQKHPTPNQVEYPSPWRNTKIWLKNRLKRKPQYDSFAWSDFDKVKIVNYPLHLPEVRKNCIFFPNNSKKTSREFNHELKLMQMEINEAIDHEYDACFAATRFLDCMCHSASIPQNHGYESLDEWMENAIDMNFNEFHGEGKDFDELKPDEDFRKGLEDNEKNNLIVNQISEVANKSYEAVANVLKQVKWEKVDNYLITSDHGFNYLGAGSVKAHSERSVFASNFCQFFSMSRLINNWRSRLKEEVL